MSTEAPTTGSLQMTTTTYNTTFIAVLSTVYIIIITASLVGNLLVCFAIVKNKALLKYPCNYFVLSLALSDVGTTIFAMPFDLEQLILKGQWAHGELLCNIWTTAYLITVPTSILNLLALSIDRYKTLKDPLNRYKESPFMTVRRALVAIAALWIYSLVFALIPTMGWKYSPKSAVDNMCIFNISPIYGVLSSTLNFVLPMLAMCWIYFRIYKIANDRPQLCSQSSYGTVSLHENDEAGTTTHNRPRSFSTLSHTLNASDKTIAASLRRTSCFEFGSRGTNKKVPLRVNSSAGEARENLPRPTELRASVQTKRSEIQTFSCDLLGVPSKCCSPSADVGHRRLSRGHNYANIALVDLTASPQGHRSIKLKNFIRNTRAARTISLIVCSFFCCWMPYTVLSFAATFCKYCSIKLPEEVPGVLLVLGYLSSALNPYLYSCQDKHFRNVYRQMMQTLCPCNRRKKTQTSFLRHFLAETSTYSINIIASAGDNRRSIVMLNAVRRLSHY